MSIALRFLLASVKRSKSGLAVWAFTFLLSLGFISPAKATFDGGGSDEVCLQPMFLSSTPFAGGAELSWQNISGAVSYVVEYRLTSSANWISVATTTPNLVVDGLGSEQIYLWHVATVCKNGQSAWSNNQFFQTLPIDPNWGGVGEGLLFSVSPYPVPAPGSFDLLVDTDSEVPVHISIFDVTGTEVYASTLPSTPNGFTTPVNLEHLPNGLYIVKAVQGQQTYSARLTLQK